ncbi:hypothetical protein E2C01_030530 [Portunus trituberculatus]|uniref:Uncharacterized protein n=1 Tax=Portunus trituberculatus TaxID=210409 RepID=A0A5B7EV17_PORTR|nr:hypothetical protein [Portunus trituberculatus]
MSLHKPYIRPATGYPLLGHEVVGEAGSWVAQGSGVAQAREKPSGTLSNLLIQGWGLDVGVVGALSASSPSLHDGRTVC